MGRSLVFFLLLLALVLPSSAVAQATTPPAPGAPPSLDEVRRTMGIPSEGLALRGQQDAVGFASRAEQMAKVWELAAAGIPPTALGPLPAPGAAGLLAPHDDYIYAGPVYRQLVPLITAKTIVLVGVFHKYRKFGVHDQLVFDPYQAWRSPDGPVPVSKLREEWLAGIPREMTLVDPAMHDSEHALEALVYWLKHQNQDIQIIPVIVPAASLDRLQELARAAGSRLGELMKQRGWKLGKDLAVVISSDGVHYGPDFQHVPFGDGGVDAYTRAVQRDTALLTRPARRTDRPTPDRGNLEYLRRSRRSQPLPDDLVRPLFDPVRPPAARGNRAHPWRRINHRKTALLRNVGRLARTARRAVGIAGDGAV